MHIKPNLLIAPEQSIKAAMTKISENTNKILFVIDDNATLIGSLSDGDIRRSLLNGHTLESQISKIMNLNPRVITVDAYKASTDIDLLTEITPVIDENRRIISLLSKSTDRALVNYENTVLLMAGGFGKRLRPLTDDCPKPMVELQGKPILLHIIEQFRKQGFTNFLISTFYLSQKIIQYFGDGSNFGVRINYLHEEKPMGTAGCLALMPSNISYPIIVANGDLITEIHYDDLLLFHTLKHSNATMVVKKSTFSIPFGVVEIEDEGIEIKQILEKPDYNFFVNAGVYCLEKTVVDFIKDKNYGYLDMPDLFTHFLNEKESALAYRYNGFWEDLGTVDALKRVELSWKK